METNRGKPGDGNKIDDTYQDVVDGKLAHLCCSVWCWPGMNRSRFSRKGGVVCAGITDWLDFGVPCCQVE